MSETQPKGGGGDGGISREDSVYKKAGELLERMPEDYQVCFLVEVLKNGALLMKFKDAHALGAVVVVVDDGGLSC